MATPTPHFSSLSRASAALSLLLLAACQQPQTRPQEPDLLKVDPPAAGVAPSSGDTCVPAATDWLELMPAHQRRIAPADCSSHGSTPLFSWGEARDRQSSFPWAFVLRPRGGGAAVVSRSDITVPRLHIENALAPGNYEWAVSYTNTRGARISTQWRRFTVAAPMNAMAKGLSAMNGTLYPSTIPEGQAVALIASAKARPRVLPAGSTYAKIVSAAQGADYQSALTALQARSRWALTQPVAVSPDATPVAGSATALAQVLTLRNMVQTARTEREYMEGLILAGKLGNNAAMVAAGKQRLLALGDWTAAGKSSEKNSDQANREVFLALSVGLDMLWNELTAAQRTALADNLRNRLLQTSVALSYLDREPYDSHSISNVRWITQALLLATGLPNFPEAPALLARFWDLSQFTMGTWGDQDGSFGNGSIAYTWYAFTGVVPYVAAVRSITGIDLYQLDYLRRSGEQLMAFTAPNIKQPSAFGNETETQDLYANYSSNYYRLHAQMTRNAQDAWYWRVNPGNLSNPNGALIWQLLLLGVNGSAQPAAQAPTQNSWFTRDAGLAAMHVDAKASARTSVFFRSSRFGAFNHSHADQNSLFYVSQGKPLLISGGYYPYYNSPHHRSVTRATRYKNALTFDGGIGQSESAVGASKPTAPLYSMDARGDIIYSEVRGALSAVTGDAALAYRANDAQTGKWTPLLSNAIRSVVMDRANGITLVYDWATSAKARQWELNFHSPNAFTADASTVKASKDGASVCLDRYGPATSFAQTMAWDVAPETTMPAQAHGRFSALTPSTELVHLTVLRDSCKIVPVQINQQGSRIAVTVGNQVISFDKRQTLLPP